MDGNADNGLGGQFARNAPNANPGAGAGNAGSRSYTRSAPAPMPSRANAGEADANPHGGIALDHYGVQPGDEFFQLRTYRLHSVSGRVQLFYISYAYILLI